MDQGDLAALLTSIAGVLAILTGYMLNRSKNKNDFITGYQKTISEEIQSLRTEVKDLKDENRVLETERDWWRNRYNTLREENLEDEIKRNKNAKP